MRIFALFLLIIPLNFMSFVFPASQNSITWLSWEEAYEKAVAENKMILIEIITNVCPYCVKMENETFSSPKIIEMINSNFYACKINPKNENITYTFENNKLTPTELINTLSLNSQSQDLSKLVYPTTIFYLPIEKKSFIEPGYQPPDVYIYMLYNCIKYKERLEKKKK